MCEYRRLYGTDKKIALTQPLPLFFMESLERGRYLFFWERFLDRKERIWRQLKRLHLAGLCCEEYIEPVEVDSRSLQEAKKALAGRCLLKKEAVHVLTLVGLAEQAEAVLDELVTRRLAIAVSGVDHHCQRCGSSFLGQRSCHFLPREICRYCLSCHSLGECRRCSLVYTFFPPMVEAANPVTFAAEFALTKPQQAASDLLLEFLQGEEKQCLLWAVCGAGKTEVTYQAIRQTLARGARVLLAIPRRDVVRELYPRLQKVFPQTKICVCYGGSWRKYETARLTIATTHQVLRFYRQFALVILDEVDAYPYRDNEMLQYAVKRAAADQIIYLTATPDEQLLRLPKITIPARHHQHPLPVPELWRLPLAKQWQQRMLPDQVLAFLRQRLDQQQRVLIFLPTIAQVEAVGRYLQGYFSPRLVAYSHSKDEQRDEKKDGFSQGKLSFLVTTTILERGITVADVAVLVLFSEQEEIFTTASLIQMAGRVGRQAAYPTGRVVFCGDLISASMRKAQQQIVAFNREAREKGYIL